MGQPYSNILRYAFYDIVSPLPLSLLMTTQEAFVDKFDQDQTPQYVQSDLWSTLSSFFILDY